jgi:DNA-binding transcriptional LysR family regulator
MDVGQPSVDQLRIFLAIVDQGSFNQAARKLGRAISVVSYGISQLEGQLGLKLFEREGSRRPVLTSAGEALLANARAVADDIDGLVAKVRGLRQGLEAEMSLAVDVMVEPRTVASVLREFQDTFPTVDLRLHVEALGAVAALLLDRRADLALAGPDIVGHPDLDRRAVGAVELVAVASPSHPLANRVAIKPGAARQHLQLVLTDRSPLTEGRDFSVVSSRTWRLADLGAKHALLLEGIGWGNMPRHAVMDDLAAHRLVELALPESPVVTYRLHALWRKDSPPGPSGQWMLGKLAERLA